MSTQEIDGLLELLSTAPDSQLCKKQALKVKELIGKSCLDQYTGMKTILDDCANFSFASDFVMCSMDICWNMIKKNVEDET